MSRKVLLEAEHSLGTKSPNWRASDALGHVKENSNLVALFNMSLLCVCTVEAELIHKCHNLKSCIALV